MEEEFEPKKKEEVIEEKKEFQEVPVVEEPNNSNKKRSVGNIISRVIWGIITVIIIAEIILGVLNTQKINDDKEPIWCFEYKTEKINSKEETTCHLGLYVIVKTKEGNKKETSLRPFFLR